MRTITKKALSYANSLLVKCLSAVLTAFGFGSCGVNLFQCVYGGPPAEYYEFTETENLNVSSYRKLFYKAYDKRDFELSKKYCKLGAEEEDPICESWMGDWAFQDARLEEAIYWYELSISHGYIRSLHGLGDVYTYMGEYEKAIQCYEMEISKGDCLESSVKALEELPKMGDYEGFCKYALYNKKKRADYAVALKYALLGGFTKSSAITILDNIILDSQDKILSIEASNSSSAFALSNSAASQITLNKNEQEMFRLKNCIETYIKYEKEGDEAAKNIIEILKARGVL